MSSYYVPNTMLNTLGMLFHSQAPMTEYYYQSYFIKEALKQLISGEAKFTKVILSYSRA